MNPDLKCLIQPGVTWKDIQAGSIRAMPEQYRYIPGQVGSWTSNPRLLRRMITFPDTPVYLRWKMAQSRLISVVLGTGTEVGGL